MTEGQDEESRSADLAFDMEIEEDLVEEVARVYGYNNSSGRANPKPFNHGDAP